jgi:hypothetical protein
MWWLEDALGEVTSGVELVVTPLHRKLPTYHWNLHPESAPFRV